MSYDRFCHYAAMVLMVLGIISSTTVAEHAWTTLKHNPGLRQFMDRTGIQLQQQARARG